MVLEIASFAVGIVLYYTLKPLFKKKKRGISETEYIEIQDFAKSLQGFRRRPIDHKPEVHIPDRDDAIFVHFRGRFVMIPWKQYDDGDESEDHY